MANRMIKIPRMITEKLKGNETPPTHNNRSYVGGGDNDFREWRVLKSYNRTGVLIRFEDERDKVFPQIYYRIRVVD